MQQRDTRILITLLVRLSKIMAFLSETTVPRRRAETDIITDTSYIRRQVESVRSLARLNFRLDFFVLNNSVLKKSESMQDTINR